MSTDENEGIPEKFGRFRVIDVLGRGAMGVVYRAEDSALQRTVAIKTVALMGEPAERDNHEARFLQEARAAGGVSHPAIITIYDVGREGDVAFIAMELLEGRELRDLIREASVTPLQAVDIAASVAEGLAYAHERGVVHRDVKPGNIMVLTDGRVKITDFGIARLREPAVKTETGMLLGSPKYMSPEQISGQPMDHRSDIFSLGIVLYEMLTGLPPFTGSDIPQLMFHVATMPVTPPSRVVPGLPPVVDYILARALKKDPDERYLSAGEFAADLRQCTAEVADAHLAAASRSESQDSGTMPGTIPEALEGAALPAYAEEDEHVELRPSPRFDSVEGLARLAVLPTDSEETKSREGWTVKGIAALRPRRRTDVPFAMAVAGYTLAALVAAWMLLRA